MPRTGVIRNAHSYLSRKALADLYLEYRKDGDVTFEKELRTRILGGVGKWMELGQDYFL